MKKLLWIAVIGMALPGRPAFARAPGAAENSAATADLIKLAADAGHAYAARDLSTLERITADDYVQTDVRGGVLTRSEWLDFVKNRRSELTVETDDVRVRYYGDVAVVTGRWTYKLKNNGQTAESNSRWTSVWTRYPNGWKRHAFQNTYVNANADRCVYPIPLSH